MSKKLLLELASFGWFTYIYIHEIWPAFNKILTIFICMVIMAGVYLYCQSGMSEPSEQGRISNDTFFDIMAKHVLIHIHL